MDAAPTDIFCLAVPLGPAVDRRASCAAATVACNLWVCAAQNIALTYRQIGDLRTAVKWFRKSADAGDGDALVQLGIHYYWGKGVRKNPRAAVGCFRAATKVKYISEVGRDDAFFLLGVASFEGKGVKPSIKNAKKMFERANIDNDNPAARKMLGQLEA